jgi:flagellar protein FlaG
MEVNNSIGIKGQILPGAPAQRGTGGKADARPVEKSGNGAKAALDEQKLGGRGQQSKRLGGEEIAAVVEEIQQRLDAMGTKLNFSVDEKTESVIIQVKNKKSDELVRQIPSKEMLELKAKLEDLMGVLFDRKV